MGEELPTAPGQRIEALDVMRGIALCGLVPMNILDFAFAEDRYFSPGLLEGGELVLWHFVITFGSGKFMSLFSLLFGAGILLATRRADDAGEPVTARYLRRLGLLWFFGMLHAYLLWYGDILVGYAVTGFVVFWCRKWQPRAQVIVGSCFFAVLPLLIFGVWAVVNAVDLDLAQIVEDSESDFEWQVNSLRGGWLEQMPYRALLAFVIQIFGIPFLIFWVAGGWMFIGMALTKTGFLTGDWPVERYRRWAMVLVSLGASLCIAGNLLSELGGWDLERGLLHFPVGYLGMIVLALGYASAVLLWCRARPETWIQSRFAAVGRMAFTNYIGQSVILGLIFYGHGLGLYASLDFAVVMGIVPVVWLVQITCSTLWMERYRFGPLEWVWRCLTYGRRFPMRRVD